MPKHSCKENPEYWPKMFQATAKIKGWTTDEDKLMVIPMFLKFEVRACFYDSEYTVYKEFSGAFVERFGLKKYAPLKKLPTISKKHKETAQAYGDRFRQWKVRHDKHASKNPSGGGLSESDVLNQFVDELNPKPLRQAVCTENPRYLDMAIRKAIELEEHDDDSFSDSDEGPAYRHQDSGISSSDDEEKPVKARKNRRKTAQPRDEALESLTKKN